MEISSCCTSDVEASNSCFQYCETSYSPQEFSECLRRTLDIGTFGSSCNFGNDVLPVLEKVDGWQLGKLTTLANGGYVLFALLVGFAVWKRRDVWQWL